VYNSIWRIKIPDFVEFIYANSFSNCQNISVEFAENNKLVKIQDDAFRGSQIYSIVLPPSYYQLGFGLFANLPTLFSC
jgi:hypothetical protein